MPSANPNASHLARYVRQVLMLAAAYALAGHVALLLALYPGFAAPLWASSGIALAAMLLGGARLWPGVFLGSLLTNFPVLWKYMAGFHWELMPAAGAIAAGASLQALAGYWGLRFFRASNHAIISNPAFVIALAGTGLISVLINGSIGPLTLAAGGYIPWELFRHTWITWYLGDLTGIIIGTPLILAWVKPQSSLYGGRRWEAAALFTVLTLLSFLIFNGWGMREDPRFGGSFLILPILAWIALRFGPRGATSALLVVLLFPVQATLNGYGPFFMGRDRLNQSLLLLGLFSVVSSLMTLMLAAMQTRQKQAENLLKSAQENLEQAVVARTRELKDTYSWFQALFEASPDAVVVHQDGVIVFANPAAARFYASGSETLLVGRQILDFVHPDYKKLVAQRIDIASQRGGSVPWLEEKLIAIDGSVIDAEVVASNVSLGGRAAVQVVVHDIRERKRAESALRESEAKFRRIVETSGEGIWTLDAEGCTQFVNSRLIDMLGYSAQEMKGRPFGDFLFVPDSASIQRHIDRLKSGSHGQYEIMLKRIDESPLWVNISATPLFDDKCAMSGVLKMLTDITDKKHWAMQIEESNSILKAAFEATADGILVVNRDGKITAFNQKFLRMWHIPQKLAERRDDSDLLNFVLNQLCEPALFLKKVRQLHGEEEESFDVVTFRDGRVFERVSISQFIGGKVAGRVWSFRDVTARIRAETERNELLNRERASRESAEHAVHGREEFLSVASHELKTPITSLLFAIQNLDSMLLQEQNEQPMVANAMEIAERQTRRLAGLVNALLDITRIQSGHLRLEKTTSNLNHLLKQVLDELSEEIRRSGCELQVDARDDITGFWDAFRIEQVLTNLINNALKYGSGAPVRIVMDRDERNALFSITDHGIGISPENRQRIFEPFERAASGRNFSGLGLGLAIVRSIVTAHGGIVDFESEPGAGSVFRVRLPLRQNMP